MNEEIRTYEPDNSLKKSLFVVFHEIFLELKRNKWLTYQLFKRQFFSAYKQSFAGMLWRFIIPLMSVGTFVLLNRSGVFSVGKMNFPYPLYALIGVAFWQIFATGLVAGANSLVQAGSMITKINFSKKSLVIASVAQSLLTFLIQFLLVIIAFFCYHIAPSKGILLVPLAIIPLVFLTLGLSLIFSIFNSIVRDIGNTLTVGLTFLMFLTPILYLKTKTGLLMNITKYNPLYYLVSAGRDLMLTGRITELNGFIISASLSIFIFIFCLILFHLTETRVVERI